MDDIIVLDLFVPRKYQYDLFEAIEKKGFRKALLIWPRRAGKDIAAFNLCIRLGLQKTQVIYYILPTYAQGKKVIFDSITTESKRIIDFIPKKLITSINAQELKIKLINGTLIQVVGSDNYDTLVGTNPQICVFSEYALQDPMAYSLFARPILTANKGIAIFLSTPRGKNHLWDLYTLAQRSKDWFCQKLTVEDTGHISLDEINKEIESGEISHDLAMQEYFTSFQKGVEGSYYSKYIEKMRENRQVGVVPYDESLKVHTFWDIGVRDSTAIIFAQFHGIQIRIIDCYSKNKEGLEHYVKVINSKPYIYGKHVFPHDIRVFEFGLGLTRYEKLLQLGIEPTVAPKLLIEDGIEAARSIFSRVFLDEIRASSLLKALENYRQEWDNKKQVYKGTPLHDNNSNYADAFRYLATSLDLVADGISAKELDRRYADAMQSNNHLPYPFNNQRRTY